MLANFSELCRRFRDMIAGSLACFAISCLVYAIADAFGCYLPRPPRIVDKTSHTPSNVSRTRARAPNNNASQVSRDALAHPPFFSSYRSAVLLLCCCLVFCSGFALSATASVCLLRRALWVAGSHRGFPGYVCDRYTTYEFTICSQMQPADVGGQTAGGERGRGGEVDRRGGREEGGGRVGGGGREGGGGKGAGGVGEGEREGGRGGREETAGGGGTNGDESEPQADDSELKAQNYNEFSEAEAESKVGPPVALDQSYHHENQKRSAGIEQEYNVLFKFRSDIKALLAEFKEKLGLPEQTVLTTCFKNVRGLVGLYGTLELNEETMQIVIDQDAEGNAVEAVNKFNIMLKKCIEFQEKLLTSKPVMEEKLKALEKEGTQTQASWDAIERAKEQLKLVQQWDTQIKHIIFDTKTSSKLLASQRVVTGLQAVVNLED